MAKKTAAAKRVNIVMPICLQKDFIGLFDSDREIAERGLVLHGGVNAARKLLSTSNNAAPIDELMEALHSDDNTHVIYVKDQHADPDITGDASIQQHFAVFGRHCVEGTEGASPVGRLAEFENLRRSQVMTTNALNLATHKPIVEAVTAIVRDCKIDDSSQVKFLVLGGLTDVLVADCARGFNHVAGLPNPYREDGDLWMFFANVGVPSNFTFSNRPSDHDAALRSMSKVAIQILKTNKEIFQFLNIDA